MQEITFWLLSVCASILFLYFEGLRKKFKNVPPGPLANYIPIIGYLPFLNPQKPYKSLTQLTKKYGKIYSLQMGSIFTVVLSDATLIREAFKRDEFSGRVPLYITHGIFHGYGLICTEGAFWKDQRGLVQKWLRELGMIKYGPKREAMQNRIMDGINLCIDEFTKYVDNQQEIDPIHILRNIVGNIVNDFVFGITYDWNDETWKHLQYLQEEGVKMVGVCGAANFLPFLRFLPKNKSNMNFLLTGITQTHIFYDGIVKECDENTLEHRDCILKSFLLEKRERELNSDVLAENCSLKQLNYLLADVFGASLDTTLSTLRWFILNIAMCHDVQDKVYKEMVSYGLKEHLLLDDIEHLPYLKASIAESQRLNSVVPCGIPHGNPLGDSVIGGYVIPKNTMILPLQYAIHMDEKLWPKPHTYSPERFIDSDGNFFTPPNFIPFQTGKRMCVGEELAKMFLNLFAANILLHFNIKVGKDFEALDLSGICGLTLSPPSHSLIFEKR